jgi:hypothetical protein
MIVKIGDKWVVKSKDGSHQFGEYDTEEAAKKRSITVSICVLKSICALQCILFVVANCI